MFSRDDCAIWGVTSRQALFLILGISLGCRLLLPLCAFFITSDPKIFQTPDSTRYLDLAAELAHDHQYSLSGAPEVYRPPGYPLFLAAGVALHHPRLITIILQALLSTVSVLLVYRIALSFSSNERVALVSALLCCFEPMQILYPSRLLTETLFTTLVVMIAYGSQRYLAENTTVWVLGLAVFVSAAAYVRVIAYFLPVVAFILLWLRNSRHAFVFLAATAVLIGPWHLRNIWVADYPGFSTQVDRAFYFGAGLKIAQATNEDFAEVSRAELARESKKVAGSEASRWRLHSLIRDEGLAQLVSHPFAAVQIMSKGLILNLFEPGAGAVLRLFKAEPTGLARSLNEVGLSSALGRLFRHSRSYFALFLFLGLILLGYLSLGVLGIFTIGGKEKQMVFALVILVAYLLVLASFQGSHRFRVPVMPLISVFAGLGFCAALSGVQELRGR